VYVSHDLARRARKMADHILVLRDGRMHELRPTEQILAAPSHDVHEEPARRGAAGPREGGRASAAGGELLLEVKNLSPATGRAMRRAAGVDHPRGHRPEALPRPGDRRDRRIGFRQDDAWRRRDRRLLVPSQGYILFNGRELKPSLAQRDKEDLRRIQIVFQMADTALNPSQTIERILARPLEFYKGMRGEPLRSASTSCSIW
jgi:peptide/nickel transport system ATP-binding protein